MQRTYKQILTELQKVPVIDTHEHLRFGHMINFDVLREDPVDFEVDLRKIILGSYMKAPLDAAAAGEGMENLDDRQSLLRTLRKCANTASYRCGVQIPLRDLYDFDANDLDENSWDELESEIADRYKEGPWIWTREAWLTGLDCVPEACLGEWTVSIWVRCRSLRHDVA